jgi:large subunit ribosomal protein L28
MRCQLTGREPSFGRRVSHSHRRTSRRFDPNVQVKTYRLHGRKITLRLSTKGIKTVDRIGIEAAVARMRAAGERI